MRPEWVADVGLNAEVRDQFARALQTYRVNPRLVTEHANLEESIRVGGYATRTMLELVQNAADALAGARGDDPGRIELVVDKRTGTVYCANSGRPFNQQGLEALFHAYLSSKRGEEIGRFGLGFKSVLAVTRAPQIFSRSVSFGFSDGTTQSALRKLGVLDSRYPVLRMASVLDAETAFAEDETLAELGIWASTIVRLPNCQHLDRLEEEVSSFNAEFLLFVKDVREIRLRVLGDDVVDTTYAAEQHQNGRVRLGSRGSGQSSTWYVAERMHEPSDLARAEVGEAVSRSRVKVTIAIPERPGAGQNQTGTFWSYFPLQDRTTATGLFNAPWSVNDDRTTLLRNRYNTEMLETVSQMFVELVPRVRTEDDPALHLQRLPARGREALSWGDEQLSLRIPIHAAEQEIIPDARGVLRRAGDLRPLTFLNDLDLKELQHEAWSASPNTGDDVPHHRCYADAQRTARLRSLCAEAAAPTDLGAARGRKEALDKIPSRGVRTWLTEWAKGEDVVSAANALRVAARCQRGSEDVRQARIIPTDAGLVSMEQTSVVFLRRNEEVVVEGAHFVDERLLEVPGVEDLLRRLGFRDLSPVTVLEACLKTLPHDPSDADMRRVWDAVDGVSLDQAKRLMKEFGAGVRVPTKDGGWGVPAHVLDIGADLPERFADRQLDRMRCMQPLAHSLGVIVKPRAEYPLEDEPEYGDYLADVVKLLNNERGGVGAKVERIEVYPDGATWAGPMLALSLLAQGHNLAMRAEWTTSLLKAHSGQWFAEDLDSGKVYPVPAPAVWAARRHGIVATSRGCIAAKDAASPILRKYRELLPCVNEPSVSRALGLPEEIGQVSPEYLAEVLTRSAYPPDLQMGDVVTFLSESVPRVRADGRAAALIAKVGRNWESCQPLSVFLAEDDEQEDFLRLRQKPYLRVDLGLTEALSENLGCRAFTDSFSFRIETQGEQAAESVLDLFPGLRGYSAGAILKGVLVTRVARIEKLVTTEDGVIAEPLESHLEEGNFLIHADSSQERALELLSETMSLGLNHADIRRVLKAGVEARLEELRAEAQAASSDAERLEVYFGPDDLREKLPKGMWSALQSQGLVDDKTSVAKLFLTVYGADAVHELKSEFEAELGFGDVPSTWAGSSAAVRWVKKMGFGPEYAGQRTSRLSPSFTVPGAVRLPPLHDYQLSLSDRLHSVICDIDPDTGRHQKAMLQLPTGAGKTRVATETVLRAFIAGRLTGTALWIAESQELCEQAVQSWSTVWRGLQDERPLSIGRLWGSNRIEAPDTEFSVVVATDAQLAAVMDDADYEWLRDCCVVIVDEAHRSGDSTQYRQLFDWLGVSGRRWERPLVGLSATPFKGNSEQGTANLATRFGNKLLQPFPGRDNVFEELIDRGVLARVQHELLGGVDVSMSQDEAAYARKTRLVSPSVLGRIGRDERRMKILSDHIMRQDQDWPILVFTPDVLSAQVLAAVLRYRGTTARAVSGSTSRHERRETIEAFKRGEIHVLTNCELLVQGFDAPGVRALYIAKPTFSPTAYIQMAGRGMRGPLNGGKDECLIVDLADNFGDLNSLMGYRAYENQWRVRI